MEAKAPIVRKVYNVDEVAEILQTSSIKVRNLIKFGYLKAFRIGACWCVIKTWIIFWKQP